MRIVVDQVYHAVDYRIVWQTMRDDVPPLSQTALFASCGCGTGVSRAFHT
jgi:uncharacterized protein with HEPN domain